MKRVSYFPYFLLFFCLFVVVNLPKNLSNKLRFYSVSLISPSFQISGFLRNFLLKAPTLSDYKEPQKRDINTELLVENQSLRSQLDAVYEWLLFDARIEEQTERIQSLHSKDESQGEIYWREFFQRRSEELRNLIDMQIQALPAKVIYREPTSWSSSIWIDVGNKDNEALGRQIISKDSPVIVGNSLIGVVEHVAEKKSRVRLITDSGLCPSVRAIRGKTQDRELAELIDAVLLRLRTRKDLSSQVFEAISHFRQELELKTKDLRLAKGILRGSSEPIWRVKSQTLQGIGFNYDYSDQEGPARNLVSGESIGKTLLPTPILQKGDLLVTTGMDGVFPPGLHVAIVTHLYPLKEGDCFYQIDAEPTASNIHELQSVFVIPKTGI